MFCNHILRLISMIISNNEVTCNLLKRDAAQPFPTSILLGWWLNHQDIGMECAQNFLRSLASNWPIVMENLGHLSLSRCLTWAPAQVCLGLELASCGGSRL